jgi:hypothetical protein
MSAINGRGAARGRAGDRGDSPAGCRFLDDDYRACGEPRRAGSSYCDHHHAICYLPAGSLAERERVRLMGRIADAVGGKASRRGMTDRLITRQFTARLERLH